MMGLEHRIRRLEARLDFQARPQSRLPEIWREFVAPAIAAAGGQLDGESPAEAVARGLGLPYQDMLAELRQKAAGGGAS